MDDNLNAAMLDRLMFVLLELGIPYMQEIRGRFAMILNDYIVGPKEEAMVVYTEGKNEYYIKRFLLAKAVAGCTKRTLKQYGQDLRRAFGAIQKDVDTVTSLDIQAFLAQQLSRGVSTTTADNYRRDLSSFYSWCLREELIQKNPMNKVEHIKVHKEKKTAFTEMELEQLRNACRTSREKAIVETLFSTGCRVSELVNIKIDDIEGNTVDVLGKGEKHRNVYLNAKAMIAIQTYLSERADTNPYLFAKMADVAREPENFRQFRNSGKDWYLKPEMVDPFGHADKGTIESIIRALGKRAGVPNTHPHRFRRTCATFALRRGMPLEQVSKMLGHNQLSTTQIYLDLTERELAQAHAKYVI